MKKVAILLTLTLCACHAITKIDQQKAQTLVQQLIKAENSGDYAGTSKYYTDDFNASEPMDARNAKFKQLHDAFGDMTGMELISSKDTTNANDWPCAHIIYRVKHTKLNSIEGFSVIWDKGDYKVEAHNIGMEGQK